MLKGIKILTGEEYKRYFTEEHIKEQEKEDLKRKKEEEKLDKEWEKQDNITKDIYEKLDNMISELGDCGVDTSYFPNEARLLLLKTAKIIRDYAEKQF